MQQRVIQVQAPQAIQPFECGGGIAAAAAQAGAHGDVLFNMDVHPGPTAAAAAQQVRGSMDDVFFVRRAVRMAAGHGQGLLRLAEQQGVAQVDLLKQSLQLMIAVRPPAKHAQT